MSRGRRGKVKRRIKVRDPNAAPAFARKAGPMKDRRAPRGGTRNVQRELLEEGNDE